MKLKEQIKQKAYVLGFDAVGITDASPLDAQQVRFFIDCLKTGCSGQMTYMYRNLNKRVNPTNLLDNANSIICTGLNYNPPKTSRVKTPARPTGTVASYACYEDYHLFIKKKLRELVIFISSIVGTGFGFKICVDSVPLAERAFAARAGLGFIGKNHMLINKSLGPQILLGEIITTLKLDVDEPSFGNCLDCDQCIAACPTGALKKNGRFDANKCISYLTIEHPGPIPKNMTRKIGDGLFGCNECILACPYNDNAPKCQNKQFKYHPDRARLNLEEIMLMTQKSFEAKFANSPFERLGLERLKRNAKICLENINQNKGGK
ncbi:MAG: tRNA epoxyqueuosine(34) reductase QueG [Sedimentisphaerales bacterium]|nr:tRNA epoxyqueuosine(34) reductase QueG [Sedimentisphaerales bacterium]